MDNDVLIEIKAAGICHSDLHILDGTFPPSKTPITLGHELSGVVAEKGRNIRNLEVGDRVGADYLLSCGTCESCVAGKDNLCDKFRCMAINCDGAWTEKIVVPVRHVYPLPHNIGFPEAAIISCAVMTAYHSLKLAEISAGETVLVYGLGGVGIHLIQWAKIFGATEIIGIDIEDRKLDLAKTLGATVTINPERCNPVEEVRKLTTGGVDTSFEVVGLTDTVKKTLACVKKGGKAVLVGMTFDDLTLSVVKDIMIPEIRIMSPQDHLKREIPQVMKFIEKGQYDLSRAVSHKMPLREVNEGVRMLSKRIGQPLRIVLEP
jgi:propanol-preferring alcohol dehydrogenase